MPVWLSRWACVWCCHTCCGSPIALRRATPAFGGGEFGFEGGLRDAYGVYVPVIAIAFGPSVVAAYLLGPKAEFWIVLISALGLLVLPVFHAFIRQYVQSNLRFGNAGFVFTAQALIGEYSGALAAIPAGLGHLHYSRHFETEADAFSREMLCDAHIDSAKTALFFESIAKEQSHKEALIPAYFRKPCAAT